MRETQEIIKTLKQEHNALILAHNYQRPEIQDIADFVGDSFGLALTATKSPKQVIIFCGVDFMAESAKILNPEKIILHPEITACCPMAAMVDAPSLVAMKKKHPGTPVVAYINTTAAVKAETDICCTSSNAIKVINELKEQQIIFIPDRNLGLYAQRFLPHKKIILWPGICPTHHNIKAAEILDLKKRHPSAEILVHPECQPQVIDIADHVYSTEGMVNHVAQSKHDTFIIGTEQELCYRLKKLNPHKNFIPPSTALCPNMKKITLDSVRKSMATLQPQISLAPEIITRARVPLQRMIQIGRSD